MIRESTLQKEKEFIESLKGRQISGEEKKKYRTTNFWKNLRIFFYIKEIKKLKNGKEKIIPNVDELTLRPLKKNYNLHHMNSDSTKYTTTDKKEFKRFNNKSHDVIHWIYSEVCKDREFLNRLIAIINEMGEINNWQDFK